MSLKEKVSKMEAKPAAIDVKPAFVYKDGESSALSNEDIVEQSRAAMYQAKAKAESEKYQLEFSRYKQDCRKRALDLAHGERERYYLNGSNSLVNQNPVPKIDADFILKQADKYYQWLIEIPQ